jgi:dTMP kinase
MQKCKFIVFEGADGSGKSTQAKLLFEYLKTHKIPSKYISFPRYKDSVWGAMIRRYLDGDFGKLDSYLASMLYAGDRFSAASEIRKWLSDGKLIVCDRYIASNIAHQGAKIKSQAQRVKYIRWLENLEYGENKIPREDLVIFLYVPVAVTQKLMKGRKLDIHEKDVNHLKNALGVYQKVSKERKYWHKLDCTKDGKLMPIEMVHEQVLEIIRRKKYING